METSNAKIILDSSIWVAFLHDTDSQHKQALAVFERIGNTITVPEYVVIEVATILKRRKKPDEAKRFVHRVLNENPQSFLHADSLIHETATLFRERTDQLSFTDTALLALARSYQVITFDRDLQRAIEQGN